MNDIDPVKFGEMCGYVKATHDTVKEIKTDLKDGEAVMEAHHDRLNKLENRNKNVRDNWKRLGWFSTAGAGIWAFVKMLGGWIT